MEVGHYNSGQFDRQQAQNLGLVAQKTKVTVVDRTFELTKAIDSLYSYIQEITDRLVGPRPTAIPPGIESAGGLLGSLDAAVSSARDTVQLVREEIARLEERL